MNTTPGSHQRDLENVFNWLEFVYKQGNSLLEAAKRRLADETALRPLVSGTCYTSSRSASCRYVWLDVDWYIPDSDAPIERALFLSMSYSSDDRDGCHLILGICDLDSSGSALIENPTKVGHWLVDYAVNPSSNPGKFRPIERSDGLLEYIPGEDFKTGFGKGLRRMVIAPTPVVWVDSEERLLAIIHALVACFMSTKTDELAHLCREAMEIARENEENS